MAIGCGEFAEEPACDVDEVDALIDQLASAGKIGIGAPFPIVAFAAAVPISAAQEHQRSEGTGVDQFPAFCRPGWKR